MVPTFYAAFDGKVVTLGPGWFVIIFTAAMLCGAAVALLLFAGHMALRDAVFEKRKNAFEARRQAFEVDADLSDLEKDRARDERAEAETINLPAGHLPR